MEGYRDFPGMSRAEARDYLGQFVEELDSSHERLVATSEASGGPSRAALDLTRGSLEPLWEWARGRFAWREGYVELPPGQPDPWRPTTLEPAEALPSWFEHPSGIGMARLSAESLWLADGLGRYTARVLAEHVPGARWVSGRTRPKGSRFANKPVLGGFTQEFCPTVSAAARAVSVLSVHQPDPPPLAELHDVWVDMAKTR